MHLEPIGDYTIRLDAITKPPYVTPETQIKLPCVCVAVARMESGKSTSVRSVLMDLRKSNFLDRLFVISPTCKSSINEKIFAGLADPDDLYEDATYQSIDHIVEKIKEEERLWKEYLENMKIYKIIQKYIKEDKPISDWNEQILLAGHTYNLFDTEPESKYGGHHPRLHLWCDDIQNSQLMTPSTKNKFLQLVTKHRHVGPVSIWSSTQSFSGPGSLPRVLRQMMTHCMIWAPSDKKKKEQIAEELSNNIDSDTFLAALKLACPPDDPHSFLFVDMCPKKPDMQFRKNMDQKIIIDATDISEKNSKEKRKGKNGSDFIADN
jgi:hypothetical protein